MATLLVVRDRLSDAGVFVRGLEAHGHTVRACGDAWNAAQAAASEQPDLMIIDLEGPASGRGARGGIGGGVADKHWPELPGVELCRALKSHGRSQRIPVVLLAGGEAEMLQGLEAGADQCVPRAFAGPRLAERIEALLEARAETALLRRRNRRLRKQVAQRQHNEQVLREHLRIEVLLQTIATRFGHLQPSEQEAAISDTLEEMGRFLETERSLLFLFSEDAQQLTKTFEWCAEGLEPVACHYTDSPTSRFPWWMEQFCRFQTLSMNRLEEMPAEARAEREALQMLGARSYLAVPLAHQGRLRGFLAVSRLRRHHPWTGEEVCLGRNVADAIAVALAHRDAPSCSARSSWRHTEQDYVRTEEALRASQKELALHNRLAQVFLTCSEEEVYGEIVKILQDSFGCQHSYFGYIDEQGDLVCPLMAAGDWNDGQPSPGPQRLPRSQWSGLRRRSLLEQRTFYVNTPPPVPEGHLRIRRLLVAPILQQGKLIGQLAVANREEDFGEADVAMINTIASCVAPVLDARLQKERFARKGYEVEKTLRENLQSLFNSLDDFLWVLDLQGRVLMVNQAVTRRLGYREAELLGASVLKVHPEHLHAEAETTLKRILCGDATYCTVPVVSREGTLIPVETHVTRGYWQDRELLFAISRDITERLSAEREVQQHTQALEAANHALKEYYCKAEVANRTKTQFLANMSHELRTPLHGILSFATFGIKKADSASPADLRRYFEKIDQSGKMLLALVDNLLDLSKLESGRMAYAVERVDLYLLALSVAEECGPLAAQRGLTIDCHKPERASRVFADPAKIMQVLRNLLSNAIKFSPEGGAIELQFDRTERTAVVSVLDRGCGIPEEELEAVFDKFIQSSKTRTGAGGTGLGLAICREIVNAHGGQIRAANRPGGGAVMSFELPLVFRLPETASTLAGTVPQSQAIPFSHGGMPYHGPETNSYCG